MKFKTFLLGLVVFMLCMVSAKSQIFWSVVNGGTNRVTTGATTNYTQYINCRNTAVVAIEQRWALTGAGTDDILCHVDGSINGSTFVNDAVGIITNAATGTDAVTNISNVAVQGFIMIRLRMENTSSETLTNVYLAASTKQGSPPYTPLAIALGGTASTTASAARTALGIGAGTNGSLDGVTITTGQTNAYLTASRAMATDANKKIVSTTTTAAELGYVNGVTSAIQTQLNSKPAATNGSYDGMTITTGVTNSFLTASLPVFTDANKALASKSVSNTKIALGIQAGTCTIATDGTFTNVYSTAFSSAPVVCMTPVATAGYGTNYVVSGTGESNILHGTAAVLYNWIAIGAP